MEALSPLFDAFPARRSRKLAIMSAALLTWAAHLGCSPALLTRAAHPLCSRALLT
jgi:hypothetical protein